MYVIENRNVNDAWPRAISMIEGHGVVQETRAGRAAVVPVPVATVYRNPTERVLFDPVRDANPIFHHMEALWMLAGRDDATWLDQFVGDFSARFAESNGRMHGAYGRRWRDWFYINGKRGNPCREIGLKPIDQLDECVRLLRANPQDRQAVIQMWDPSADLGVPGLKDRPCNQQIMLRTDRRVDFNGEIDGAVALDMTVTNRSNDAVYGCYGANAVHMSILQEYLASRIGCPVGTYTQFSNNLHLYEWSRGRVDLNSASRSAVDLHKMGYPGVRPLMDHPDSFDVELNRFFADPNSVLDGEWHNSHFREVAWPLYVCNQYRRDKNWDDAIRAANSVAAPDLRRAAVEWVRRREAGTSKVKETRE